MFGDSDERTPLLQEQFPGQLPLPYAFQSETNLGDSYKQFITLIGKNSADEPSASGFNPAGDTLYHRALRQRKRQALIYALTRALTNTLLLAQVVLGAALTGLGAADSPGWLITIFGAANTVIAGLVAFLKSRGQPMRARMFRDDLDRVVDEIENSATMWRGISQKAHGYDAIDTDDAVTVRSEVARLTRLYDRAVKTNTMNDPDHYGSGISVDSAQRGLKTRTGQPFPVSQPQPPALGAAAPAPIPVFTPSADPDESPATQIPVAPATKEAEAAKGAISVPVGTSETPTVPENTDPSRPDPPTTGSNDAKPLVDVSPAPPASVSSPNPDESPATSTNFPKAKEKSDDQSKGGSRSPSDTKESAPAVNGNGVSQ